MYTNNECGLKLDWDNIILFKKKLKDIYSN